MNRNKFGFPMEWQLEAKRAEARIVSDAARLNNAPACTCKRCVKADALEGVQTLLAGDWAQSLPQLSTVERAQNVLDRFRIGATR